MNEDRASEASPGPGASVESAELESGTTVQRYVVLERVGVDANAFIYAAFDPKLDRKVALKVLTSSVSAEEGRRGLLDEAQALAKLTHPNVVRVHDVGTFGGRIFIAREFVEGRSLLRWMREAPRTRTEFRQAFALAGRGLAAAHEAGIVHGSLRPRSVLVGVDGAVRVTDFGFGAAPDETTPYAAIEVRHGEPPTPASDQFSFCVALVEALTGMPAAELSVDGRADLAKIRDETTGVPRRMVEAMLRGLAEDAGARHPTMLPLVERIEPRRRGSWMLLAAGAVAAAASVTIAVWSDRTAYCDDIDEQLDGVWDRARRREIAMAFAATGQPFAGDAHAAVERRMDELATEWAEQQRAACLAGIEAEVDLPVVARRMFCLEQRLGELQAASEVLASADADVVEHAHDVVDEVRPFAVCDAVQVDPPSDEQRARVTRLNAEMSRALAMENGGRGDEALSLVEGLLEEAESVGHPSTVAHAYYSRAILMNAERVEGAEDALHDAFSRALALGMRDVMSELGLALASQAAERRRFEEAELWLQHADALQVGVVAVPSVPGRAGIASLRGRIASLRGEFDEAVRHFEDATSLRIEAIGADHHRVAIYRVNLGQAYSDAGRYEDAEREYRRALELQARSLGDKHPIAAQTHMALGNLMNVMGKPQAGLDHGRKALDALREVYGDEHTLVGDAHITVAGASSMLGRHDEGMAEHARALEVYRASVGEESFRAALAYSNIAAEQEFLGRADDSLHNYDEALQRLQKVLGPEHPVTLEIRGNRVGALLALRAYDDAEAEARAVIEKLEAKLGRDHPGISFTWECMAETHAVRGRDQQAIEALERALELRAGRGDVERAATELRLAMALRRAGAGRERAVVLEDAARAVLEAGGVSGREALIQVERSLERIGQMRD